MFYSSQLIGQVHFIDCQIIFIKSTLTLYIQIINIQAV